MDIKTPKQIIDEANAAYSAAHTAWSAAHEAFKRATLELSLSQKNLVATEQVMTKARDAYVDFAVDPWLAVAAAQATGWTASVPIDAAKEQG